MAVIGTFQFYKGKYHGGIETLSINKTKVEIVASELTGDSQPQWLVMAGSAQVGAGWNRESQQGRKYISIKLDDPSFTAPVHARLMEQGDIHHLIWSRSES